MKAAKKAVVLVLLFATAFAWTPIGAGTGSPGPVLRERILPLLHDGRFDEAERVLAGETTETPALEVTFLGAFVTYWRLLYDDDNENLQSILAGQLDRSIALADQRLDRDDKDVTAMGWGGSSRLLRAQLYAKQRRVLKSAYEAKRAKRMLERSIKVGAHPPDVYFGLGMFNYYASQIPTILKGLRFLLALPGGNRELGLEQLEEASRESRYFALEARMVLTKIYSSRDERMFEEALVEAERALDIEPRRVAVLHAASLLDVDLHRPRVALDTLSVARSRAARSPETDSTVLAVLRYHSARAQMMVLRPDLALEEIRPLIVNPETNSVSLRDDVSRIARDATRWIDVPGWVPLELRASKEQRGLPAVVAFRAALSRAREALEAEERGEIELSAEFLTTLADSRPGDVAHSFLAGRALLLAGRGAEAFDRLATAERSEALPGQWIQPCRLLAGRAADLAGRRSTAIEYYERVIDGGGFTGRNAAYLHLRDPFERLPQLVARDDAKQP
jgi:tetratricopeptide (TPR) repeat protein